MNLLLNCSDIIKTASLTTKLLIHCIKIKPTFLLKPGSPDIKTRPCNYIEQARKWELDVQGEVNVNLHEFLISRLKKFFFITLEIRVNMTSLDWRFSWGVRALLSQDSIYWGRSQKAYSASLKLEIWARFLVSCTVAWCCCTYSKIALLRPGRPWIQTFYLYCHNRKNSLMDTFSTPRALVLFLSPPLHPLARWGLFFLVSLHIATSQRSQEAGLTLPFLSSATQLHV